MSDISASNNSDTSADKRKEFLKSILTIVVLLALLGIGFWMYLKIFDWLYGKAANRSESLALAVVIFSLIFSVLGILFYFVTVKAFLLEDVEGSRYKNFIHYLFFFGRDLTSFYVYFLSFAYLCYHLQSGSMNHFSGADFEVGSFIKFSFKQLIDIIYSDLIDIYNLEMSGIEPVSLTAKNLLFAFRLFIKFIIIVFFVRIFRYLFYKGD